MNFLKKIFGKEKLILQDKNWGKFESLNIKNKNITWRTSIFLFKSEVSLYLDGSKSELDESQKEKILDVQKNQTIYEKEVNFSLKSAFEDANKKFTSWDNHFTCIAISANKNETKISFEEKESFYLFNIFFKNQKAIGISIDS